MLRPLKQNKQKETMHTQNCTPSLIPHSGISLTDLKKTN